MIPSKIYLYTKQRDIFSCLIYGSLKIGKSKNKKSVIGVTFVTFLSEEDERLMQECKLVNSNT